MYSIIYVAVSLELTAVITRYRVMETGIWDTLKPQATAVGSAEAYIQLVHRNDIVPRFVPLDQAWSQPQRLGSCEHAALAGARPLTLSGRFLRASDVASDTYSRTAIDPAPARSCSDVTLRVPFGRERSEVARAVRPGLICADSAAHTVHHSELPAS